MKCRRFLLEVCRASFKIQFMEPSNKPHSHPIQTAASNNQSKAGAPVRRNINSLASDRSLRAECGYWFPMKTEECLRKLARDIASLDWKDAQNHGLVSATPAPFNLLANGETASGWMAPTRLLPTDLVAWKHSANGFPGHNNRGLALMFDPFVDACLLIEARRVEAFQTPTKVLVLTDYSDLKSVIGEMAVLMGQDWAEVETGNFFKAKNLGLTGTNLFKCLLGKDSIREGQALAEKISNISNAFGSRKLLLWNYFPFLRGGNDCEGMDGLPDPLNCDWIRYCDGLLLRFLQCVNADRVIFAANRGVKKARANCVGKVSSFAGAFPIYDLDHPGSWRGNARLKKCGEDLHKALAGSSNSHHAGNLPATTPPSHQTTPE